MTTPPHRSLVPVDALRRRLMLAAAASPTLPLLAACGTTGSPGSGPAAPAPDWQRQLAAAFLAQQGRALDWSLD